MKKEYFIIGILIIAKFWIMDVFLVKGDSMNPTLNDSEIVILNKFNREFKKGDLVTFKLNNQKYIKRIVGVCGDEILYKDEQFYINNVKIPRGKYFEKSNFNNSGFLLKENQFFVLGDNIQDSIDSRLWGAINKEMIIGKVIFEK